MKKSIPIIAVLLIVIVVFVVSMQYKKNKVNNDISVVPNEVVTQATNQETTTEKPRENVLLVETDDKEYQVYFDGKILTFIHGAHKFELENFDWYVGVEEPTVCSVDVDGDGQKELLFRMIYTAVETYNNNWEYVYTVMMFKPVTRSDGKKEFDVKIANNDTWRTVFEQSINCEMTQLKNCKKILQFAMDDVDKKIAYDEKTGISLGKHVGYAKALTNSNNEYYTLDRWKRGAGIYKMDKDGNITLDIQVLISYEGTGATQYIGDIHCDIDLIDGKFSVVPKTILFKPSEYYKVNDPRDTAKNKWSCVINNSSSQSGFKETDIDWIENEFSLTDINGTVNRQFGDMPSKIKCVDSIRFTQNGITITAKPDYNFSPHMVESGKFSVIQNVGKNNEVDIAYTAVIKEIDGRSTLVIVFDRTYDKDELSNIKINFGV